MSAYYNENDPKAASWLRELIKEGLIAKGDVDERSIKDVESSDLIRYTQCHFFAGIGGWSYALRLAKWSDHKPVWTGSCPCQPFSQAGNRKGKQDDRHLWPEMFRLIRQYKPDTIIGEQVEGAIKHGWLDDLQRDLEAENYAVGYCVLGAHSINAPHIRQRLYWVADTKNSRNRGRLRQVYSKDEAVQTCQESRQDKTKQSDNGSEYSRVGDTEHDGHTATEKPGGNVSSSAIRGPERKDISCQSERASTPVAAADISRCEEQQGIEWLYCRDGKYRPIKSGVKPLVDGLPRGMVHSGDPSESINETQEARTMRLKGYGNAIVPQVAAEFIKAFAREAVK